MKLTDKELAEIDGRLAVSREIMERTELSQKFRTGFENLFVIIQGLSETLIAERLHVSKLKSEIAALRKKKRS